MSEDLEPQPTCGVCGALKKKAIYGMPAGPMDEERYVIMGCMIDFNKPMRTWICTNCEEA